MMARFLCGMDNHFGLPNKQEIIFSSLFSMGQVFCISKSAFSSVHWISSTEICKAFKNIAVRKYKSSLSSWPTHQSPPAFAPWLLPKLCAAELALRCLSDAGSEYILLTDKVSPATAVSREEGTVFEVSTGLADWWLTLCWQPVRGRRGTILPEPRSAESLLIHSHPVFNSSSELPQAADNKIHFFFAVYLKESCALLWTIFLAAIPYFPNLRNIVTTLSILNPVVWTRAAVTTFKT